MEYFLSSNHKQKENAHQNYWLKVFHLNSKKKGIVIFIINCFRTIVFIFIVISTMFQLICPPAFFRYLSNLGTFIELQTMSFIESTHNSSNSNQVRTLSLQVPKIHSEFSSRTHGIMVIGIGSLSF